MPAGYLRRVSVTGEAIGKIVSAQDMQSMLNT